MSNQMKKNARKNARIGLLFLLLATMSFGISAQTVTLTGNIKDNTGEAIIGATVLDKSNTRNGAATDFEGNFTIKVSPNATVIVSYVGMKTQEINVTGKSNLSITLEDDVTALEEVVVIGYGTVKRKDLTGSVSTIQGSELAKIPVSSAAQALTGRLAGVQITTTDGSPDAEILIRVRGGGSITGDNSPLYIVDGFPVSSIGDVAPTDIQDVTVLKDASSTAIYGSRGANGVILITTKGAQGGKTMISYNGYIQGKTLSKKIDVLSPYEFVMFNYEKAAMRKAVSSFEKRYGAFGDLDLYQYQKGSDWQDEMFGHAELSQSHNISVTGGSDKTKFTLSGTYVDDTSLMKENGYSRFNLNYKLNHEIAKGLKLDFGTRISDTETKGVGTAGGTYKIRSYDALMKAPVNGLYDFIEINPGAMSDEELDQYLSETMGLQDKVSQSWRRKNERRFNLTGGLSWAIVKNLTYRLEGGYDYTFFQQKDWHGAESGEAIQNGNSLPLGEWSKRDSWKYRFVNTLNWKHVFNKIHDMNLMLGQEVVISGSESNSMTGKYFQKDITPEKMFASMANNSGETGSRTISSSLGQEDRTLSFFGRFSYNLAEKYLLTFTLRTDGSSKFVRGNRWGVFPAAAVGWRINQEDFMENTQEWLSNLKLRGSYGEAGNNRIGSGMYETLYRAYSSSKYYGAGNYLNPHYTLANSQMANPTLKWETTVTRNGGLDYGFFNERLSGSIDIYWNTTKDLLVARQIVAPGYSTVQENIGQTSNRGIEFNLQAMLIEKKDFNLSANFNIGFNRNRVDKLADTNEMTYNSGGFSTDIKEVDDYRVIVGEPLGLVYGFVYDGIYGVDDFETYKDDNGKTQFQFDSRGDFILKEGIANNNYLSGSNAKVRPGAMKLKDLDGSKTLDTNDRQIIGRTAPKHTGGFGLNAYYKGIDFSAMFNWVYGNQVYNMDKIASTQSYRVTYANLRDYMGASQAWTYLDRTTGEIITDYEALQSMNANKKYWSPLTIPDGTPLVTSWAVEDGSYLRLQNLTVGYTLPKNWTRRFACTQLRVYCTLNNVWTWTSYTGYDPEVSSAIRGSSSSGVTPGADFSAYPKSLSWTAGVNISF
ncbi:TonB-dependent receptor SusC [termite gut metagenome]|uniref:TonB-dependent receptor SusC n=1 Tax=termite gut metagenome TaxID=433724 RepID=A0A5J4T0H6_9ZZZZ